MPVDAYDREHELVQARRHVRELVRKGVLDTREANRQLQAIDRAARFGGRVLIVADLEPRPARRLDRAS